MEEEKKKETFTKQEVMEIVSKMQNDYKIKMQECTKTINELNGTLTRLNFLLQIVNSQNIHLYSDTFITKCAEEIESIMTIPEDIEEIKQEE